jgi:hypothetical protein
VQTIKKQMVVFATKNARAALKGLVSSFNRIINIHKCYLRFLIKNF